MKKEALSGFLLLLLIVLGCTQVTEEKTPEIDTQDIQQEEAAEPEPVPENKSAEEVKEPAIEEPLIKEPVIAKPEPIAKEKEKFHIFNPKLTYDGAYNGPLYGTSEQVGSASMDSYFENLDRNGINFFIGFFTIEGEPDAGTLTSDQGLGEVIDAVQKHPYRIIPFFNPGIGGEEIEKYLGSTWLGWYKNTLAASQSIVGNDFIKGFGEIETQEWSIKHNDPKVTALIQLADDNNIDFMFHPVAAKIDDVTKIIEAYPDINFIIHLYREDLDKSRDKLIKILKEHGNIYFSMDAAHIMHVGNDDIIYSYNSKNKKSSISTFVSTYDSKEKSIINDAISDYKPLVDAVPDKVMWGTEMGPEYSFDPEVFDRAIKASRFVIAGFAPEHQEMVGYKNALRVFGQGVVADSNIKVIDTRSWPECTDKQVDSCDDSCEIEDTDSSTIEQDACFYRCVIDNKCREIPEMDVD
jgi:hypothetical protein